MYLLKIAIWLCLLNFFSNFSNKQISWQFLLFFKLYISQFSWVHVYPYFALIPENYVY